MIEHPFEPFDLVETNIDKAIIRKNLKKPVLPIIDGGLSTGKTTLAILLMDMINVKHGLPIVDLDNPIQYAMGGEDFIRKLKQCYEHRLPVITYDEAGDFSRKGALTKFNKTLNRVFETFRAYQIIVIMVLPNFSKLSRDIFDNKIPSFLIHLKERKECYGVAHFYENKSMFYIMHNMKSDIFPEASYSKVYPNFKIRFRDLSPERSKQLDKLSTLGKREFLEMAEIKLHGLLSYDDIAMSLHKSKIWVKKKVSIMNIKPQIIYKKVKYFSNDVVSKFRF